MQAQFTEQTRRALAYAHQEASENGSPCVEPEHLLLAVLRGDHSEASAILRTNGYAPERIYEDVCALLDVQTLYKERAAPLAPAQVVLSASAQATLATAARIAAQSGRFYMGTDHILAALVAEPTEPLAGVWKRHGVTGGVLPAIHRPAPRPVASPRLLEARADWSRYTFGAKQAIVYAGNETTQSGHNWVLPPFLLAGVLHEADTVAAKALRFLGVERNDLRIALADLLETGTGYNDAVSVTFSKTTITALDEASRVAQTLGDRHVGTEHLLLGLLAGQGETADLLRSRNVATANFLHALRSVKRGTRAERKKSNLSKADVTWTVVFSVAAVIALFVAYILGTTR